MTGLLNLLTIAFGLILTSTSGNGINGDHTGVPLQPLVESGPDRIRVSRFRI